MNEFQNKSDSINLIDETSELRLEHEFESVYLVRKADNQILNSDDFNGDPECGLIDKENNWAIVAGSHLTLWTQTTERKFQTKQFKDIHSIRLLNGETIEILTDPWAETSAVWKLNLITFELTKVADFEKYQGKEYSENVEW